MADSNKGENEVPRYRAHIDKPAEKTKPASKWKKGKKMWMKNPANGVYEWVMYIVEPKYNEDVRRYYYRVRNEDGIEYNGDVAEGDLKRA